MLWVVKPDLELCDGACMQKQAMAMSVADGTRPLLASARPGQEDEFPAMSTLETAFSSDLYGDKSLAALTARRDRRTAAVSRLGIGLVRNVWSRSETRIGQADCQQDAD